MVKTLYISDLDGTLMNSDQRISDFTAQTITKLVEQGMLFSYATARSLVTALRITSNIRAEIPVIVYNGAFIVNHKTGELLDSHFFAAEDSREILASVQAGGISPIVYAYINGREYFSYIPGEINPETRAFLDTRAGDIRERPVCDRTELAAGQSFYFTCIGSEELLFPLYERYRGRFYCVYQKDIYSGDQWLEIMPGDVNKANATQRLAAMYGCERIVAFGDGVNDLPMFRMADECYAVANAANELKAAATTVIDSNNDDGVAHWLLEHAKP